MTALPELSRHPRLAERDRLVWGLLTDELAPEEHIEAWHWCRAAVGPRSWGGVVRYMLWGFWWSLFRLVVRNDWRRLKSVCRRDGLAFRVDPYVAVAKTNRRILATRIEFGRRLWRRTTVVRPVGERWSVTDPTRLSVSPVLRGWVMELEGAPQSAVPVYRDSDPNLDAYVRRGAQLVAALEAAGWVQPAS